MQEIVADKIDEPGLLVSIPEGHQVKNKSKNKKDL
jgi:hypothetical protein